MPKKAFLTFSLIAVSVVVYFLFGYVVMREQTVFLLSLYAIVFAVYFIVLKKAETETINFWLITAFVFRVVFIFSVPGLSDDIFRFLWDGKLLANGFSPYAFLPSDMVELQPEWSSLYYLLNSKNYHSIYPPFAQLIFWLSAVIAPDSITFGAVVIRILVIAAEFGSILLMIRLLKAWGVNKRNVLLYALNPLVIVELTGNLHFEVFVIFFVLLSFYLLTVNRSIAAGCAMGLAIAAKLIPLILLPMFLVRLSLKKNILFYGGCVLVTIALFYPFFSTLDITGFYDSFLLYFKKFEFNASIYYLVREYGYWDKGYNIIQT